MSYRQSDPFNTFRGNVARSGAPLTVGLIIACVVTFLVDAFGHGLATILLSAQFDVRHVIPLWGIITYPFANPNYISVVFGCIWLWFVGASLERSWGTQRFAVFAAASVITYALSVYLGCALLHASYVMASVWFPLTAMTVAWATINPKQTVMMYMVLPVPAMWLALFEVGVVYFVYFGGQPVLGLFGLIPCIAAYYYVSSGMAAGYSPMRGYASRGPDLKMVNTRRGSSLDGSVRSGGPFGWYKDWQERRRLRKLWRDSGFGDQDRR